MNLLRSLATLALLAAVAAFNALPQRRAALSGLSMISDGRRPLMGGNWKLNPVSVSAADALVADLTRSIKGVDSVDTVIFPPFPLLPLVHAKLAGSNIKLGAQDCFYETSGAFTGAVSTELLKEVGVSHILVGHSERRTIFKESDEVINKKVKKVLKDGLSVVLCVGESKEEYEAGLNQQVCALQLIKGLRGVTAEEMDRVVLAYEPVWAIGTGLVCPKEVAQEVHHFIRSIVAKQFGAAVARKLVIQYGGSVNASNVKQLMAMPDIDGCLVGGASLSADSFSKIVGFEKL